MGFSLAEALIVVCILGILAGVGFPAVARVRTQMRQTELDAKAELIYTSVQNQLVKLRSNGTVLPEDMPSPYYESGSGVCFLVSGAADESSVSLLLPDETLRSGNWIIEYAPLHYSVNAVFYSEEDLSAYAGYEMRFNELRDLDYRLSDGAGVGYYNGSVVTSAQTAQLHGSVQINNAETLTAVVQCDYPAGMEATDTITFSVVLRDATGTTAPEQTVTFRRSDFVWINGARRFSLEMTLDSLTEAGKRFSEQYPTLVPGPISLTLTVKSSNNLYAPVIAGPYAANSSFADASTSEQAVIGNLRHLQNLSLLREHTRMGVTSAVQNRDLDFSEESAAAIAAVFEPITLPEDFRSYDGQGFRIASMAVTARAAGSAAGLFDVISGKTTLSNMTLTGPRVSADAGSAGALAGEVAEGGRLTLENCCVYLTRDNIRGIQAAHKEREIWVSGTDAGGLVGSTAAGSLLNVTDSFASTVVSGTLCAGGLVGNCAGEAQFLRSYSSGYVYGVHTGGLAGGTGADEISLRSCYAAGFQTAENSAAGLVNGDVALAESCYSISAMSAGDGGRSAAARSFGSAERVFCGSSDEESLPSGVALIDSSGNLLPESLGSDFVSAAAGVHPYNLTGQSLSSYTYPRLQRGDRTMDHYGDWEAPFQPGALVYYEKYRSGNAALYGFFGANAKESTLRDNLTILGDGYGLVYRAEDLPQNLGDIPALSYRCDAGEWQTLDTGTLYPVTGSAGEQYYIIPLPRALINESPTAAGQAGFYRRIALRVGAAAGDGDTYAFNPFFAKTALSLPEGAAGTPDRPEANEILLRTPRQLYNVSLYYELFHEALSEPTPCTLRQECDIRYGDYDWEGFFRPAANGGSADISVQQPIGSALRPFRAIYNGQNYLIADVSFVASEEPYVGLFGYNEGTLENIVLFNSDFTNRAYVHHAGSETMNAQIFVGAMVGRNSGEILNCAAAGYALSRAPGILRASSYVQLCAGGFVGENAASGVIRSCSSDCPGIRLSSLDATVELGGFAGRNQGTITGCYDLASIEAVDCSNGTVKVGGFAGSNTGTIRNSYCATSLLIGGSASACSFAPREQGYTQNCRFLSSGTYFYHDTLYSYSVDTDGAESSGGSPVSRDGLVRGHAAVRAVDYTNSGETYPYPAVVTDRYGSLVHYGTWQKTAELGRLGLFYWEHETGGANNGYHLTYIGIEDGELFGGSTLCTIHDDGGIISEYGYGYFTQSGFVNDISSQLTGLRCSGDTTHVEAAQHLGGAFNQLAQDAFEKEISDYVFFPYTSRVPNENDTGDYICLDSAGVAREGEWDLVFQNVTYQFTVSPFFANAMRLKGVRNNAVPLDASFYIGDADYRAEAGGTKNHYEIRSVQQLRYLNWNSVSANTGTLVSESNYRSFPFLQYASTTGVGTQNESAVYGSRPRQYWQQTHDLSGESGDDFTPIAGAATSTTASSTDSVLYAWFGGDYDGGSYKIQNLPIRSDSYTVGLFGVTSGANLNNVILYSDAREPTVVERRTDAGGQVGNAIGAYSIGGLVGIAYDYSDTSSNVISNCAIAGYRIVDRSTNQQAAGKVNIGGLVGTAKVSLSGCSAVVTIDVDSTNALAPQYGNYIRVGGLVGSTRQAVTDCYTGGQIRVRDETLHYLESTSGTNREKALHIYIGGISGGVYSINYRNITGRSGDQSLSGTVRIRGCYTYTEMPNMGHNIRGVALIASLADRYFRETNLVIEDCFYLDSMLNNMDFDMYRENIGTTYASSYNGKHSSAPHEITRADYFRALCGDMRVSYYLVHEQGSLSTTDNPAYYYGGEKVSIPASDADRRSGQ